VEEQAATRLDAPAPEAAAPQPDGIDLPAAWDAARDFARAARGFVSALAGLARSELHLARASWPWVFALLVLLVGLALSLWISLIALAGWSLYVATGSVGWALAALVGLHLVLLIAARLILRRTARNMTLPATRAEIGSLLQQRPVDTREPR
jgi:hypothetical protein